jgi:hypothetical protein
MGGTVVSVMIPAALIIPGDRLVDDDDRELIVIDVLKTRFDDPSVHVTTSVGRGGKLETTTYDRNDRLKVRPR